MAPLSLLLAAALCALASLAEGQVVGRACNEAPDCGTGAFCGSTKVCQCLYTYISSGGFCIQKINPDQPGCSSNIQCSSVWPGATCSSGTCKCPNNQPAFLSRDGTICLNYGSCPINAAAQLTVNGVPMSCTAGIDASCGSPVYECLCNMQDCLAAAAIGYCCPTRAFTCAQPFNSGNGGGSGQSTRYYYNTLSGTCQTFSYAGSGGNANNFNTLDQCQSYCMTGCTRGNPQYTAAVAPNIKQTITTCSSTSTSSCLTNYACQNTAQGSYCCPTTTQICCTNCGNNMGGVQYTTRPATNYDPGIATGSGTTYIRYYYDSGLGRCTTFTYLGQGGNFNNFGSLTECQQFCSSSLCTAGSPLLDGTGLNNIQCPSTTCPATHSCTNSVCCPTKQTLCSQPLQQGGPCSNIATRYWYNAATGNCQTFQFTGCNGNDNNFATFDACQSFCGGAGAAPQCPQGEALRDSSGNFVNCGTSGVANPALCSGNGQSFTCLFDGKTYGCCPTQAYTCQLTSDSGTNCVSSTTISRWVYLPATRTCTTFTYGGCDGNSNNFATQQDCLDYCQSGGCPNGGDVYTVNGAPFVCGASTCPSTHTCTTVSLGSLTTTYQYCCPTRSYICSLPRNAGVTCGVGTITRYYFDSTTRQCLSFQFNGCQGNRNSFSTIQQCRSYCYSADCPDGEIALTDASGSITSCTGGSCTTGYTCTSSALMATSICCGSPAPAGSCPADRPNAFIDPFTTTIMNCIPNLPATCPSNNICNFANNNYYCCGFGTQVCPNGGSPFIDPSSNLAIQCVIGTPNNCAAAGTIYTCQTRQQNVGGVVSTLGTCCSPGPVDICGSGYTATLLNGVPAPCNPNSANICPSPATCRLAPSTTASYYCCTLTGVTTAPVAVCNGAAPYTVGNAPVICNNGLASTNCPSPYSCIYYSSTNVYYCCTGGTGNGGVGTCPTGFTASVTNGVPNRCSPSGANSCGGVNNLCQFLTQYNGYVCCIAGSTVPAPAPVPAPVPAPAPGSTDPYCSTGVSYLYQGTTLPLACTVGGPACPSGYTCRPSKTGQGSICCTLVGGATNPAPSTGGTGGCPASNPNPYWYDSAKTLPLGCTPGGTACPAGYSCVASNKYAGSQCCQ